MTHEEELARYDGARKISASLLGQMSKAIPTQTLLNAGTRLGRLRDGELVFENQQETVALLDFTLFHQLEGGQNGVQRFLTASPPPAGSPEEAMGSAMMKARYSIFEVLKPVGRNAIELRDVIRADTVYVADPGFNQTAGEGLFLATHLIPLPDFAITTGAALPLDLPLAARIARALTPLLGKKSSAWGARLNPARESDMAAITVRFCLESGVAAQMVYTAPPRESEPEEPTA